MRRIVAAFLSISLMALLLTIVGGSFPQTFSTSAAAEGAGSIVYFTSDIS